MKLRDLIALFAENVRFAIEYKGEYHKYDSGLEFYDDCQFYDEVCDKLIAEIWDSRHYHGCIVITID